jgi:hypothetical protein
MSVVISSATPSRFKFDEKTRTIISTVCVPSDGWTKRFESASTPHGILSVSIRVLEACAERYLNERRSGSTSATVSEQRKYLRDLRDSAQALKSLLTEYPNLDGRTADPFKFLERNVGISFSYSSENRRNEFLHTLHVLETFAADRIKSALVPYPGEKFEESTKRKHTFSRLVLLADLLAAYVRITSKVPTATAHDSGESEAVRFLMVTSQPILRVTADSKTAHLLDPQTVRKDIATIKRLWKQGFRPELTRNIKDWGKHSGPRSA